MSRHYELHGRSLVARGARSGVETVTGDVPSFNFGQYDGHSVIALGKAANPMLEELLRRLPTNLPITGVCSAPSLPLQPRSGIRYFSGGHPLPNQDSLLAARAALDLVSSLGKNHFVFFLISGGGSAMFDAPLDPAISLEEMAEFHRALVGCGAAIAEINVLRKHFSAVKGGRLAAAAGAAVGHSILVSDVPAAQLDALASGPVFPDPSTVAECRGIIEQYRLLDRFPASVRRFFENPRLPETPKPSRSGAMDARRTFDVLLSNEDLLENAGEAASSRGWTVVVDNRCDDWDYHDAANYLVGRLAGLRKEHSRVCLLSGGEVTVQLDRDPGIGGRNQQLALACALEWAENPPREAMAMLSAGSDGVDGVSPAAGAIADTSTIERARMANFDAQATLEAFDCYSLFNALGDTVVTGPTGNNLRDLRILLTGPPALPAQLP